MRFFILLTVLLALVSCNNDQKPITNMVVDAMMEEPDRFPEITISSTLELGKYRMKIDGFAKNESRLRSVYIQKWEALLVLEVLRINFNPQPWLHTKDNERVVLANEEIVIEITDPPQIVSRTVGSTIHYVYEYEGIAVANLTRPYIVFESSPPIDPDDDDTDVSLREDDDTDVTTRNDDDISPPDGGDTDISPRDDDDEADDTVVSMPEGIETLNSHQRKALQKFGKNDRITVKNTLNIGLRIRNAPNGIQTGGMFDGEIGTITSGPKIADGLVWFKIEWNRPVKDPRSGCGDRNVCIGWSAAVIRDGTEVLDL